MTEVMEDTSRHIHEHRPQAGPAWIESLRRSAIERLETVGFPARTDEEWRTTNIDPIVKTKFVLPPELSNRVRSDNGWARRSCGRSLSPPAADLLATPSAPANGIARPPTRRPRTAEIAIITPRCDITDTGPRRSSSAELGVREGIARGYGSRGGRLTKTGGPVA